MSSYYIELPVSSGGGSGTITNGSNVGVGGVGPFDSVVGTALTFKNVNAGSNKVLVSDDVANKEIDIDIDETKINVRNLTNVSPGTNGSFTGWSDTGVLASVPGFTFDDIGSLRVGAQNSITIPATVTDYISLGISPTVANPGLVNLSGVQLNTPINQPVTNYCPFQSYGYGTSAPGNYIGMLSQPGYSGTGTNATGFLASGSNNVSGYLRGFEFSPSSNSNDSTGLSITPSGATVNFEGINISPTGSCTNARGIHVNLTGITSTGRNEGISLEGGVFSSTLTFSTTSSLPTLVDSGNTIRPVFEVKSGSPITGTDVLMTNMAGLMDIKDNYSPSALGLGVASVGFVSQVAVASGKTASNISMLTAGMAVDATSAGGTVTDVHMMRVFAANFGGSLNIGTIYGLQVEDGMSALATNAYGISVEDTGADNWMAKSLKIGGTKGTSDASIGIELGGTKTLRLPNVTNTERGALPMIAGTMVYDSDDSKCYYNTGSAWVQF